MIPLDTLLSRSLSFLVSATVLNMSLPFSMLGSNEPEKPAAPEKVAPKSRALTEKEMSVMSGRISANPYVAGQSKWDMVVKGVNLFTGNYSTSATDLMFEGGYGIPVNVTRSYSANNADEGPMGKGWTLSVDVRTTAGGLLKSPAAPVRATPTAYKERHPLALDPAIPDVNEPVEAVIATDAGGKEETIQKDVDGVLTTPPWDNNIVDSEYETVVVGGVPDQLLIRNVLKTPEGTTYVYEKKGSYTSGTHPFDDPTADTTPCNVLKVVSVTDRHENETEYTYGNTNVTFQKSNGAVAEKPLTSISMPNGHVINFTWGTGGLANRIVSASDGTRTVEYEYTDGLLTSVTSPAGKVTSYGYQTAGEVTEDPDAEEATGILHTITDPRGMVTTIVSVVDTHTLSPYDAYITSVITESVTQPNGIVTYFYYRGMAYLPSDNPISGAVTPDHGIQERAGGISGPVLISDSYNTGTNVNVPGVYEVVCGLDTAIGWPNSYYGTDIAWQKTYDSRTQNLLTEVRYNTRAMGRTGDLAQDRRLAHTPSGNFWEEVWTTHEYNFLGNPLKQEIKEYAHTTLVRTTGTEYAYHGRSKYYQQKAVKDNAGRYSFTEYYDNTAAQGKKGQTYRVYGEANATLVEDTNISVPSGTPSGNNWKYRLVPQSGTTFSGQFDYDSKGRPTEVWKLQTSAPLYIKTSTTYGADSSPWWGAPSEVVEDASYTSHATFGTHSGVNRTTQTLTYDSIGRATEVQDAAGKVFETVYDLDGQIQSITRTDTTPDQPVVTYTYGTSGVSNGMPTVVTDEIFDVEQTIAYINHSGYADHGQVSSVTEVEPTSTYSTSYTYNEFGDREKATYVTPQGTTRWGYYDYVSAGTADAPARVFQTLNKLNGSSAKTSEEMHYAFDHSGRLTAAAFAQSPQTVAGAPTSAPFYPSEWPANTRARAYYDYDPGGRLQSIEHYWDTWVPQFGGGGDYDADEVLGAAYTYDSTKGLRLTADFYKNVSGAWTIEKKQAYAYDADLDYLTQAKYDDDGNGTWDATHNWTYDVAGNRASDSSNTGTWTYDALNRMTSSPGLACENDILGNRIWQNRFVSTNGMRMEWDVLNRMTSACKTSGGARYEYRADGMRIKKVEGLSLQWQETEPETKEEEGSGYYDAIVTRDNDTTRYRYDGQMLIEDEYTYSGNHNAVVDVNRYGLGARGIDYIAKTTASGTTVAFPIYDGHGNMVATLGRNGAGYTLGNQRHYDAWGKIRSGSATGDPKGRYVATIGHIQDDETGLIYMRARYYEPTTGRFVSEDPQQDGTNWFIYTYNDPINLVDKSGMESEQEAAGRLLFYEGLILVLASVMWENPWAASVEMQTATTALGVARREFIRWFKYNRSMGCDLNSNVRMAFRMAKEMMMSTGVTVGTLTGFAARAVTACIGRVLMILGVWLYMQDD